MEALKPPETTHWTEANRQEVQKEHTLPSEGQDKVVVDAASVKNSTSIVASMKKVISSLGPNVPSLIANFVHINDCLKENSEKCSEQAETLISDLSIRLVMVRHGDPDPHLQGELRNRLRLLENDNKEVAAVFSELSARLLSIQSDKDIIIITFKTFEEIWKFSTYYSLGFLNHCMENMFLDQSFWLSSPEEEDAGIHVCVNEESLNLIYKGLLMEEGMFFVLCPDDQVRQAAIVDNALQVFQLNNLNEGYTMERAQTKSSTEDNKSFTTSATSEPLCPFHQWFLKINSVSDLPDCFQTEKKNQIAVGWTEAVVSHESDSPDEITYQTGDIIEIISTFIECLKWFVGRNMTTGEAGFVKTSNVKPYASYKGQNNLSLPICDEKISLKSNEEFSLGDAKQLLHKISNSDVCNVYRVETLSQINGDETGSLKQKMVDFLTQPNKSQPCPQATDDFQDNDISSSSNQVPTCEDYEVPSFCICEEEETQETLQSLLLFLNSEKYMPSYRNLYDISYCFLHTIFKGYDDEEDLGRYLSVAREASKKSNMTWALTRICFLLGRLCTKRNKFSQARVYFEEAIGVLNGDFGDLSLISAVYMNLTAIYLKQKIQEKCMHMMDKAASLLLGLQNYTSSTDMESVIMKYALKVAILSQDQYSETRACFLLAKLYTRLRQYDEALPFLERLQVLNNKTDSSHCLLPGHYFQLADIYGHKCLPHMALSCIKVLSCGTCGFTDSLKRVNFIIGNASKLCGIKRGRHIFPTQIAYYLRQALGSAVTEQEQILCTSIYLSLCELCTNHKQYQKAKLYILKAVDTSMSTDIKSRVDILVSLAWLYMLGREHTVALKILNTVLELCCCTPQQLGIVHNLSAIALRWIGNTKEAAEHYCKALEISRETDVLQNQAAALANFGTLYLHLNAHILAEHFLVKSVSIYSRLSHMDNAVDFIQVLLILGHFYIGGIHKEKGRFYYEWAFLVAMETNHLECQLQAIQLLCHFYSSVVINEAQCIIYNEYQLSLARKMSDKVLEGQVLEAISQLYLSLGTERACKSALEYTKRSLGIFIDLQKKEKEAYAWLWAGKIHYILGQNELVELYIQAALNVALYTGDPSLGMQLFEAAGDIFFNGTRERDKAVSFYRDCALPLALKIGDEKGELRLCNKLTELLMNLKNYEESLEHAKTALGLSVNLGNQLNERVAYHRLAGIYSHLGQCELAEHFYLKALSLCTSPMELDEEAIYYMKVYLVLGDIIFYDLKDPFDAAGYYHLALAAAMDLGNKKSQLKIYTRLAVIYHNFLVDREKSLFFYQKARTFASELNVRRINLSPGPYYMSEPLDFHALIDAAVSASVEKALARVLSHCPSDASSGHRPAVPLGTMGLLLLRTFLILTCCRPSGFGGALLPDPGLPRGRLL
ncbi:SH3 domain and tetratricopeptide repeat-containing protein 1 [Rhinophrynus dorsalis]